MRGFTLNEKRLQEQEQKLTDLRHTVGLLEQTLAHQAIGLDGAKGLLHVITDYAYALTTLDRFDHGTLVIDQTTQSALYILTYEAAIEIVRVMQPGFGGLFGLEKAQGFKTALGAVYQTFGGDELYPMRIDFDDGMIFNHVSVLIMNRSYAVQGADPKLGEGRHQGGSVKYEQAKHE